MMKANKPARACIRCGKLTRRRRNGRPACLACAVRLDELTADKDTRKQGKLKDSRGW